MKNPQQIFYQWDWTFFFLFILFLNSVVTANQQMRSTTNLLIINLAVADILFVIFCVPFTATDYVFTEWPFGDIWCKFVSSIFFITKYRNGIPRFVHLTNKLWFFEYNLYSVIHLGAVHDSCYLPCKRIHISIDVIW